MAEICYVYFTHENKIDKGVMLGRTPTQSLGWSPSNHSNFRCTKIWVFKIVTGQEFGSQISLPDILSKLNTFNLGLVYVL